MKNIQLTCAHALVRFLTKQKVLIDGKNIINDPYLRKKWFNSISHVPQDVYLCDGTFSDNGRPGQLVLALLPVPISKKS